MSDAISIQIPCSSPSDKKPPVGSNSSISTSTKKRNESFCQYVPLGSLIILSTMILIIVVIIISRMPLYSRMPIAISSTNMNKSSEENEFSPLVHSISLENMLVHLRELKSRPIESIEFNHTIDYLTSQLEKLDNFVVEKFYFSNPKFEIDGTPILLGLPNKSNVSIFTYSKDFLSIGRSKEAQKWSLIHGRPLSIVLHSGCNSNDWNTIKKGDVALVRRGNCTFDDKFYIAMKKRVSAILIYDHSLTIHHSQPINDIYAPKNNTIPALSLSYDAGMRLILANITRVYIQLKLRPVQADVITNICAYTKLGNPNQTIVIGSHSDSVEAGSGINDNGSGMAGTLVIASNLAHLLNQSNYSLNIHSRIKFCWWGGEEKGLLGSKNFVQQAKLDGSLKSYSVNLNFDMLASPNFMFGIYNGKTANNRTTPLHALSGSNQITNLFIEYFDKNHLPWTYANLTGRSDYGPFLAEGIASGGLFTGAKDINNQEERDRYLRILGSTYHGMANTNYDPCYHQKCDTLENLNTFAYLHMVKAAAYSIDFLAQLQDLNQWLYS